MGRSTCVIGAVLICLFVGSPVAAETHESESAGSRGVTLFAEYLLVRPTLDDTYFVLNAPGPSPAPTGLRENNDFDFASAFRVGGSYELADSKREVELGYTRLDVDQSETVSGGFLWATVGRADFTSVFESYAGAASSDIDVRYQRIDAHLTQPWHVSGIDLAFRFGLEWADFRVAEDYAFASGTAFGTVSQTSRSWGIGPEIGLGVGYEICRSCGIPGAFSVGAASSFGLLLSETNTRTSNVLSGNPVLAVKDDEASRVIAAIHARVGFDYAVRIADRLGASIGLGYQIDSYQRGLTRIAFPDDVADGLASTDYYDLDLQGLYVSFGLVF